MLAQISLGGLDYTAIGVYGIVIILIAAWCSRQQQSASDFLLAGRSMGWIVIGISQLASLLSAISYLGNPGEAYAHDLKLLIYTVCGFLVVPIVIYLFLDFFYRLNSVSIYEYLERRFNYPTRVLASAIFIAARLAWMATIVAACSVTLEVLTGLNPTMCILVTAGFATAYTLVGGMKAIIWTDVIQFFLFTLGLIAALVVIGQQDSLSSLQEIIVNDKKLRLWDFSFDPTTRLTFWMSITAGLVAGLANMTDQVSMQRYLSAKSLREARKAVLLKPLLTIPITILTFLVGLSIYAHYQLHPELTAGLTRADQAFPHLILHEFRGGLAGLIIAAIFAAAMSSIDSGIHTISTVCIEDYYKRLIQPSVTDHHCLVLARLLTFVWGIVIAIVALLFAGRGSIVEMMSSFVAPFFGCAVGIFILGSATRRVTSWGAFSGALIGYTLVLWLKFCVYQADGQWYFLAFSNQFPNTESVQQVSKFWFPFVSFSGTVLPGYLISLVLPPPPPEKLKGLNLWDKNQEPSPGPQT